MRSDVRSVIDILPLPESEGMQSTGLIFPTEWTISLRGELVTIPYRLYFDEPDPRRESNLSDTQRTILNCIFLRHHDGYLRERRLRQLTEKQEIWTVPFTTQLLGEYVFEILEVLDQRVNSETVATYRAFTLENPNYWRRTQSRVISYWNEYYRKRFPELQEYLGTKIVDRING